MLPPTADAQLLAELAQVISAGWKLINRPQAVERIPHILQIADPMPDDDPSSVATRFLRRFNQAIEGAADEGDITDDEARGLRILFGLEPSYREASVTVRRANGGSLLLGRDNVEADSFYRSHEHSATMLALECLRGRYGQEERETAKRYESVKRHSSAFVNEDGRMGSVIIDNVYRALIDDVDIIGASWTVGPIASQLIEAITIEPVSGIENFEYKRRDIGDFELKLTLPAPVAMGSLIPYKYQRFYHYVDDAPPPKKGHVSTMANNRGYKVSLDASFLGRPPPVIWRFSSKKTYIPGSPRMDAHVQPDTDGRVYFPETNETDERSTYGLAWEWE